MALLQGILKVHVLEARDLHEVSSFKPQDPYCLLKLGKETQRTAYKSKSGKTANWDEVLQFHLQKQKLNIEEGEFEDLLCVEVWDSNVVKDAFISEVYLRLRDLVSTTDPVVKWYPMNRQEKKGRLLVDVTPQAQYNGAPDVARKVIWPGHCVAGEIKLCTQYFPPMILKVHKARKLYNATWFAHQHPACSVQVGNDYYSTKYVLKGGSEPSWMENFFINPDVRIPRFVKKASESKISTDEDSVPEQYPTSLVSVTVYSAGNIKNDFIGKAVVPLSTLIENGGNPMWFQLGRGSNASIPAGEIMLTLHQCQPRPQPSGAATAAIFGPESMNAQSGQEAAQSAAENRETPASTPHSLTHGGSTEDLNKVSVPATTTPDLSNIAPSSTAPTSPAQTVNHVLPLLSTGSSTPAGMLSPVPVADVKPAPSASPVKLYDSSEETDNDHPSDAATYWKQFQQQQAKAAAAAPVKAEGAPSGVAEPAPSVSAADQLSQASKEEERANAPGLVGGAAHSSDAASTHSTPASPPVPIRAVSVVTQL